MAFCGLLPPGGGTLTPSLTLPAAPMGPTPLASMDAGEVVGWYYDANYVGHGFLRAAHGTFNPV